MILPNWSQVPLLGWMSVPSSQKAHYNPSYRLSSQLKIWNLKISAQLFSGKESACNAGDLGLISGLGRSPGTGHGNPLQYSCLENPMDRGAWRATVHGVAKSQTRLKQFSTRASKDLLQVPFLPTVLIPVNIYQMCSAVKAQPFFLFLLEGGLLHKVISDVFLLPHQSAIVPVCWTSSTARTNSCYWNLPHRGKQ